MIGIISAMQCELDELLPYVEQPEKVKISGIEFTTGTVEGKNVVMAVSGIGKVFAGITTQTMILRFGADMVINTGVAGTLCNELGIEGLAISTDVVQHDMDTTPFGDPKGLFVVEGENIVHFPADERLVKIASEAAEKAGLKYLCGTIATGDQFLADTELRRSIGKEFNAIAGEMEGGSVGQVAYINKVPFVILRSISDDMNGSSVEDYNSFKVKAAKVSAEIALAIIRS